MVSDYHDFYYFIIILPIHFFQLTFQRLSPVQFDQPHSSFDKIFSFSKSCSRCIEDSKNWKHSTWSCFHIFFLLLFIVKIELENRIRYIYYNFKRNLNSNGLMVTSLLSYSFNQPHYLVSKISWIHRYFIYLYERQIESNLNATIRVSEAKRKWRKDLTVIDIPFKYT